jgi:hypothetical protein
MGAPQRYVVLELKLVRWHDGMIHNVGPNSLIETDPSNIVVLGGVLYVAKDSQVNVLLNTIGPQIGIGTTDDDLPVALS